MTPTSLPDQYATPVRPQLRSKESVRFTAAAGVSLLAYPHSPGEEMWFHYFWLPGIITSVTIGEDVHLADLLVWWWRW